MKSLPHVSSTWALHLQQQARSGSVQLRFRCADVVRNDTHKEKTPRLAMRGQVDLPTNQGRSCPMLGQVKCQIFLTENQDAV
jgi:hypothetical protein